MKIKLMIGLFSFILAWQVIGQTTCKTTRMIPLYYLNERTPPFELIDAQGVKHSLEDYRGKKLILFFFHYSQASDSELDWSCNLAQMRYLTKVYAGLKKFNIEIVGIAGRTSPETIADYKQRHKVPFTLLSDDHSVASRYGTTDEFGWIIRSTFIFDEQGLVVKAIQHTDPRAHVIEILLYFFEECYLETLENMSYQKGRLT